jgi:hypothetical protein
MIVIQIDAWCRDSFSLVAYDNTDIVSEETIVEYQGYVPKGILGGGDTIRLSIDNATGRIIGWEPLDLEALNGKKD